MERLSPEIVIPGHGLVVFGRKRAVQDLRDGAAELERLVRDCLALMDRGAGRKWPLSAHGKPSQNDYAPPLWQGVSDVSST